MTNLSLLSSLLTHSDSTEPPSKRSRNVITPADHVHEQRLISTPFEPSAATAQTSVTTSSDISEEEVLLKRLVRAMTARDTIDFIYNKLHSI